MPTSNDTRVRVDGFSKIIASALPASGRSWPPFGLSPRFSALPRSRIWRSVSGRPDRGRGSAWMSACRYSAALLAPCAACARHLVDDGHALVECALSAISGGTMRTTLSPADRYSRPAHAGGRPSRRRHRRHFQALEEAPAARLGEHLRMRLAPAPRGWPCRSSPSSLHALEEARPQQHRRAPRWRRHGQRIAAIGRAVGAGHHAGRGLFGREQAPTGKPPPMPLAVATMSGATPDHS